MENYANRILSLSELQGLSSTTSLPLVDGFIDKGSFCILAGSSKAGKSALATNLAFSVALGKPFLGMNVTQGPVLWVTYEESPAERWLLCRKYEQEAPLFHLHYPAPFDTAEGISQLRSSVEETKATLVVLDALVAGVSCESLTESVSTRKAMKPLNDFRISSGTTVLLLHHQNKGQHANASPDKMSDSHQIASICTQFWNYSYRKAKEGRLITLEGRGRHENGDKAWKIKSLAVDDYVLADEPCSNVQVAKRESIGQLVLDSILPDKLYTAESLAEATRQIVGSVRNALKRLVAENRVVPIKVPKQRGFSYKLSPSMQLSTSHGALL